MGERSSSGNFCVFGSVVLCLWKAAARAVILAMKEKTFLRMVAIKASWVRDLALSKDQILAFLRMRRSFTAVELVLSEAVRKAKSFLKIPEPRW